MNPPEGDLAIQVWVHWDHVSFSIPYWYTGTQADEVFVQLLAYLKLVKETAGFLAYDPQTDQAFDPAMDRLMPGNAKYVKISANLPAIIAEGLAARKKPWWKFW